MASLQHQGDPDRAPVARVALAGNPNAGKTSLFNQLVGARQHVGNYAGVTVEKRVGKCRLADGLVEVLDLPGTYSLTSFTPEERVAQEELSTGKHDVVVVVVDSTNLKRNMVLLAQIMQTGANLVLSLNMADEAHASGMQIDVPLMEALLGIPVVETVGKNGSGIQALKRAIARVRRTPRHENRLVLGEQLDRAIGCIVAHLSHCPLERSASWVAMKLLLGDPSYEAAIRDAEGGAAALVEARKQRLQIEAETGSDIALFATERYFAFVNGLLQEVVQRPARLDSRRLSDRIDSILVHKFFGLPIFAAVMYSIFWLTFALGDIPMGWIETGFAHLAETVSGLWPASTASPLRSLIVDGVIGGVGGVLVFLPNILLLFFGLGFLEDSGYMARIAFITDRVMHRFGLHGKSFIPMMVGLGCSIPGIMATRTVENQRDRLATILVLPLVSCGARLTIWLLLIPAFFPASMRAPVLWLVYAIGIAIALMVAWVLRRSVLRGEEAPFVMELPPYRMPTLRAALTKMLERAWMYVRKAGTIILGASILMWFLTAYPKPDHYRVDAEIEAGRIEIGSTPSADSTVTVLTPQEVENRRRAEALDASFGGRIGHAIEPALAPLGFDSKLITAMLGAFAAKELFVAQLGIVYSMGETQGGSETLRQALRRDYSPLVGFCLILFLLISTPCISTFAITTREAGSWKWAALQLGGLTAIAYVVTFFVHRIGLWVGPWFT